MNSGLLLNIKCYSQEIAKVRRAFGKVLLECATAYEACSGEIISMAWSNGINPDDIFVKGGVVRYFDKFGGRICKFCSIGIEKDKFVISTMGYENPTTKMADNYCSAQSVKDVVCKILKKDGIVVYVNKSAVFPVYYDIFYITNETSLLTSSVCDLFPYVLYPLDYSITDVFSKIVEDEENALTELEKFRIRVEQKGLKRKKGEIFC